VRERHRSDDAQDSELEILYQYAPAGLCRLDPKLRIERISDRLVELIPGVAPARAGERIDRVWPDIAEPIQRAASTVSASAAPERNVEWRVSGARNANETQRLSFSLFPVFENGSLAGFTLIVDESSVTGPSGSLRGPHQSPSVPGKSEQHFRSLVDMSPAPIVLCDDDERIHYINPSFTKTFGYEIADIPTLSHWFRLAYPDPGYRREVYEEWEGNVKRVSLQRTEAPPMEARIRCKNGEDRTAIIGVNFLDDDWRVVITTFFDVTELRATEKRIKRLSRLYAALSGCQEAIIRANSRDEIFARVCSVIFEEGVAKLAWVGVVDNEANAVRSVFSSGQGMAYLRGIHISMDPADPFGQGPSGKAAREGYPVWCQDFAKDPTTKPWRDRGQIFGWASSASLPLREKGKVVGVLTLYFNEIAYFDVEIQSLLLRISASINFALDALSEQASKDMQETLLRKSEERYRRIVETSLEGIWLIDAQARTSFVNPKMVEMLGYAGEEMYGRPLTDFLDGSANPVSTLQHERSGGPPQDVRFRRKDGSDLWALLSWCAIYEEGAYAGALAMVMDFTERKRLQGQIESQMRLLEEADRHKNEFLATLAHELRNPLATVNLVTERVEARLDATSGGRAEDKAALKRAIRQGKHLARLVDELVQVSRITTGKIDLHAESVDLVTFIPEAAEVIEAKMEQKRIVFTIVMQEASLPVQGDPVRLAQVFGNLLDNAVKFTDAGGRIELTASRSGAEAVVTVRDNGRGIPPDQLNSIFELFQQMKHGTERKAEGLGIGLALARQLVELHGGTIDATSDGLGCGAVFTVKLPLACREPD
jgi:PAS domain S-box-containing protein